MLSSQSIGLAHPSSPAAIARERLLRDRTMRRNQPPDPDIQPLAAPSVTTTFSFLAADAVSRPVFLAPAAQRHQVIMVARGFQTHYLAEMDYDELGQLAIGRLRSKHDRGQGRPTHEITVDTHGNVNVTRCHGGGLAGRRVQRLALLASALLSAAAALQWGL